MTPRVYAPEESERGVRSLVAEQLIDEYLLVARVRIATGEHLLVKLERLPIQNMCDEISVRQNICATKYLAKYLRQQYVRQNICDKIYAIS